MTPAELSHIWVVSAAVVGLMHIALNRRMADVIWCEKNLRKVYTKYTKGYQK